MAEYGDDGIPGACEGSFFFDAVEGPPATVFHAGACSHAARGASRAPTDGFRCAAGGKPVRIDAWLQPLPD